MVNHLTNSTDAQMPSKQDALFQQVRKIIAEVLELDPNKIDPDAKLIEELGMDSMKALEILAMVEKRFRIKVPENNLPRMTTLNNIIRITRTHVSHI